MTRHILVDLYESLKKLNFYTQSSDDEYVQKTGRIATKIAIVLLIGSLALLTFYSGLVKVDQVVVVPSPTFDKYQCLVQKYPNLICSCSNLQLSYSSFINLELQYHQVGSVKYIWMVT